ncbi:hypothetical protein TWF694_006305 [Orbilia ellipsospora]|uniref:Uncharacterized protein n=1 Tax=Orbilia ellipsospora TaxID=2528407 RepID=A0AAV9XLD4_9PEZI
MPRPRRAMRKRNGDREREELLKLLAEGDNAAAASQSPLASPSASQARLNTLSAGYSPSHAMLEGQTVFNPYRVAESVQPSHPTASTSSPTAADTSATTSTASASPPPHIPFCTCDIDHDHPSPPFTASSYLRHLATTGKGPKSFTFGGPTANLALIAGHSLEDVPEISDEQINVITSVLNEQLAKENPDFSGGPDLVNHIVSTTRKSYQAYRDHLLAKVTMDAAGEGPSSSSISQSSKAQAGKAINQGHTNAKTTTPKIVDQKVSPLKTFVISPSTTAEGNPCARFHAHSVGGSVTEGILPAEFFQLSNPDSDKTSELSFGFGEEILAYREYLKIQEDWTTSLSGLTRSMLHEVYLSGKQLIVWDDEGKLCWGSLDGPDNLILQLETMKMAWPRFHSCTEEGEHGHLSDSEPGTCSRCIEEMDPRNLEDFAPAIGFPPISRPKAWKLKATKKKKAKAIANATAETEEPEEAEKLSLDALRLQGDAEKFSQAIRRMTGNELAKEAKAGMAPTARRFKEAELLKGYAKDLTEQVAGLTREALKIKVPTSTSLREEIFGPSVLETGPSSEPAKKTKKGKEPATEKEQLKSVPVEDNATESTDPGMPHGIRSPLPRKKSSDTPSDVYDKLRAQRLSLSLGVAKFVMDAISHGKRPFFDVSMDGRIEMGVSGDVLPVRALKAQTMIEPEKNKIKLVTAPVVRIRDRKIEGIHGPITKREMELVNAVAYQELFRKVAMEETSPFSPTETADAKGKSAVGEPSLLSSQVKSGQDGNSERGRVSFGSERYTIIPASTAHKNVYTDVQRLAGTFVSALDLCGEAKKVLAGKTKEKTWDQRIKEALEDPHESKNRGNKDGGVATASTSTVPTGAEVAAKVGDALSYQKEELLQLLKEIPTGKPPEKMGFETHLKEMDKCLKGIQKNFDEAKRVVRTTLNDHLVKEKKARDSKKS